ncbi:MAG: flagellar biosynthesis protein FlhF [Pseudomonadota bacterium]
MRIEKYRGRDSREVMAKVRAELGADAYILANRRVGNRVELTVAQDLEEALNSSAPADMPGAATRRREPQLQVLERELDRLRGMLESELGERSWRDVAGRRPTATTLRQRLLRMGLSRRLAGSLLEGIPRDADLDRGWRLALGGLRRRLPTAALAERRDAVTALYGGTGVGKTSTITKLAGRDVARLGSSSVALISLDSYRLGAREQLASFAEALGIELASADDARSLARALRRLRGRRVYIDTAGMSQRDPRLQEQLGMVAQVCKAAEHLIVLAASSQAAQSRALVEAFRPGTLSGAIISKVDEAQTLGGVLDVLLQAELALYGLSDGQRIPQDFYDADAHDLVERAVALAPPAQSAGKQETTPARLRARA